MFIIINDNNLDGESYEEDTEYAFYHVIRTIMTFCIAYKNVRIRITIE